MGTDLIKVEQVGDILHELENAFFDIPFENSDFQNQAFVVAAQQTPARAYRAIGLRMHSKIQAIKEYIYQQELTKIDIDEKEAKLEASYIDEFEKRRIRLEIAKIKDGRRWGEKLLNDALRELTCLNIELQKLPKYSRAAFEAEEQEHFTKRLTRALKAAGPSESLLNMTEDLVQWGGRVERALANLDQRAITEE